LLQNEMAMAAEEVDQHRARVKEASATSVQAAVSAAPLEKK
jgi:hypothetical protein